jgi:hypothetical protein
MTQKPGQPTPRDDAPFDHQPGNAPYVEDTHLPAMKSTTDIPARRRRSGADAYMQAHPEPDTGGTGRMEPAPPPSQGPQQQEPGPRGPAAYPDQQEKAPQTPDASKSPPDSYVRLRLGATGTTIAVLGATEVAGPLVTPDRVGAGLVYEITSGERRIGLGWLPNGATQRSFTNIDRPEAELGHHIVELESFEFTARIPRADLTAEMLPSVEIVLYRLAVPPEAPLTATPLSQQTATAATATARLTGIALENLDPAARADLTRIFER